MSKLDDAVAAYMAGKQQPLPSCVTRLHPINTRRYVLKNGYEPAGRSEVWCVGRPGQMFWHRGPFELLEREYRRSKYTDWYLVPVAQHIDYSKAPIHELRGAR